MSVRQVDPEALHLFQLIGAPLLAVVQAEAQAAQVSAEFIKRIGFEGPDGAGPQPPASDPAARSAPSEEAATESASAAGPAARPKMLQDGGDLGGLKVASFEIDRYAPNGERWPFVVRVPVLSLFPIPLMQIKDAEFAFNIHVVSRVPLEGSQGDSDHPMELSSDFLRPDRVELKGFLASSGGGGEATNEANIKVRVRMEQSDLPAGLMKLMTVMSDNATAVPKSAEAQSNGGAARGSAPGAPGSAS